MNKLMCLIGGGFFERGKYMAFFRKLLFPSLVQNTSLAIFEIKYVLGFKGFIIH